MSPADTVRSILAGRTAFVPKALAGIALVFVASQVLSPYWQFLAISALVTAIGLLGLGVVSGSAGMISLCQLSFAAVGGWVVAKLNVINAPGGFIVWVIIAGLAAVPFGVLIGLPALRLRGVHLAVVTLGFATAADAVIQQIGFPGSSSYLPVARPTGFITDQDYLMLTGIVLVVLAVGLGFLNRSRIGASWRAVRFSERATAASGYSVARTKLTAFAVSAFIAGVSGGLLAGQVGLLSAQSFSVSQSLIWYVLAVMVGAHYVDGAVFGGILSVGVTELLSRIGLNQNWSGVVFGLGALQALASGMSLSEDVRMRLGRRARRAKPTSTAPSRPQLPELERGDRAPLLRIQGLGVRYGAIAALTDVDLTVPAGVVMGLIGPNGAGKSTLTDAVTGFISHADGSVELDGKSLVGLSVRGRSQAGMRRTFQQGRVPPSLTIREYLRFASHGQAGDDDMRTMLDYLGCPLALTDPLSIVDVGTRRLVEVAGVLLDKPRVAILDEPAAGLGHEESVLLGERLADVPKHFGTSLLVIEHDLDLVRAACSTIAVLNFGQIIASGPPAEVLTMPEVTNAYLGELAVM